MQENRVVEKEHSKKTSLSLPQQRDDRLLEQVCQAKYRSRKASMLRLMTDAVLKAARRHAPKQEPWRGHAEVKRY